MLMFDRKENYVKQVSFNLKINKIFKKGKIKTTILSSSSIPGYISKIIEIRILKC